MNLSYRAFIVWKRNLISYKRFVISTLLVSFGEPLFYLVAFGLGLGAYMGAMGGKSYLYFLSSGLVITSVMMSSTFECLYGSFIRMTHEKIFASLIVTPLLTEEIIVGEILWGITRGLISGILMLFVSMLLGIFPVNFFMGLILLMLMALTGLMFSSFAMIITSFAPNFDFFSYYSELFITPMFFFGGVFFPLDKMPDVVKTLANFLPLTHVVVISRAIFDNSLRVELLWNFSVILMLSVVAFCLAIFFMKKRLVK